MLSSSALLRFWMRRLAGVEVHLVEDLQLLHGDHHQLLLRGRAAGVLGHALLGGAVVFVVRHGVAVGVLGGAALFLRDAGGERAGVDAVEDAVLIVVGLGAPVAVLEVVPVFRLIDALVEAIDDAVLVLVGVGAALVPRGPGHVGAAVEGVDGAVAVVVGIGRAVLVLEAVLVLGQQRGEVAGVLHPVAVAIELGALGDHVRAALHAGGLRQGHVGEGRAEVRAHRRGGGLAAEAGPGRGDQLHRPQRPAEAELSLEAQRTTGHGNVRLAGTNGKSTCAPRRRHLPTKLPCDLTR